MPVQSMLRLDALPRSDTRDRTTVAAVRLETVRAATFPYAGPAIRTPDMAVALIRQYIGDPDREHFVLLGLDVRGRPIVLHTVSVGTLDSAAVHPREVFKVAILHNCYSIIVAHNHPSGDPTLSSEDRQVTRRLQQAGVLLMYDSDLHLYIGRLTRAPELRYTREGTAVGGFTLAVDRALHQPE